MIVDLKSTDKTNQIIKNMEKQYECLQILSWKECKEIMDNIDDI